VATTCDVPWTGPSYTIDEYGFSKIETIDTSCIDDVIISMTISHGGGLENSDFLQIYYQIDDEPEILWADIKGEAYSNEASLVTSGSQLKIRTVGDLSWYDEFYYVQLFVTASNAPIPAPTVPMPVAAGPAPVTTPVLMPVGSGPVATACNVPWTGPSYTIDENGFSKIETIDTSCVDDVIIAVSISHSGGLEDADFLQIYYQIDNQDEVLWANIKGEAYSNRARKVASGSQLKIRTVGDSSWNDEFYYIQLWVTQPDAPIPAPIAPTPMPVAPIPIAPVAPGTCPDIQVKRNLEYILQVNQFLIQFLSYIFYFASAFLVTSQFF
jgi:hypothetical protein